MILFVAESPSYSEKPGEVLSEKSKNGKFFNQLLKETPYDRLDINVTYLCKQIVNGKVGKKDIKIWSDVFEEEVKRIGPQVVVGMGKNVIDHFAKGVKLQVDHGKRMMIEWKGMDLIFVPWYSPSVVFADWSILNTVVNDARRLEDEINFNIEKEKKYELVEEDAGVGRLLSRYDDVGFDVESTSPTRGLPKKRVFQSNQAEIVGASFSAAAGEAFYLSLEEKGKINEGLAGVLESPLWNKIVAGGKFEYKTLQRLGVTLYPFEDIQLAAALVGEDSMSLKVMGRQLLGDSPETIRGVWGGERVGEWGEEWESLTPKARMENSSWEACREIYEREYSYGCTDADNTLQIWYKLKKRMDELGLWGLYEYVEKPLVPVLAKIEMAGVGFDLKQAKVIQDELNDLVWVTTMRAETALIDVGVSFVKIKSGKWLSNLFDQMGAPEGERTDKSGQRKTDETALTALKYWWPEFIECYLDLQKYTKLLSFVDSWIALVVEETGRIHTSINQSSSGADNADGVRNAPATGRLSSSGPNFNQVPHHSDEAWGAKLRSLIAADDGWVIMAADAEQEEPRVVAVVAYDLALQKAFRNNTDIYRQATCAIYPHTIEDIPDSEWKIKYEHERYGGKTFFLAWYYGAGPGTLINNVDSSLSLSVANEAVENLAKAHPARTEYLEDVEKEVLLHKGWATDIFGRKRFFPEILTGKYKYSKRIKRTNPAYQDGLRKAANFKVQGPCATILKKAIVKVDSELTSKGMAGRILFPVHDELVMTCPREEVDVLKEIVIESFQSSFNIVLPISVQVGKNWGDMIGI